MNRVIKLIEQDELRLEALNCVYLLDLPQCYIAAGFVRNLVWDHLHNINERSRLNDIDVIYFDPTEMEPEAYKRYELYLKQCMPRLNWQVRNQAFMHIRNKDEPYKNTLDAMSYWPEKETAVAVRKTRSGSFEGIAAFGLESLFNLALTYNPKRSKPIFEGRIKSKKWLEKWPKLMVNK